MAQNADDRYSRHRLLEDFSQEKVMAGSVLIVGAGGLGSPCAYYLAAAGVGRIGIADGDVVSLSNLQRQILHTTDDLGRRKVDSAAEKMHRLNPEVEVVTYPFFLDDGNVDEVLKGYDFIIEASDNFQSRYRISDACLRLAKPYCIGGVSHYEGQLMTCLPGTPSYRDLYPTPPAQSAGSLPVFGPAVGMLGTVMAAEALKLLAGTGQLLTGRLYTFDALTMQFNTFNL